MRDQQKKATPMQRLIKRVRRNKVTLFIGSGFSIKAGAPSVADLINNLITDGELSYDTDNNNLNLRDVASDFVEAEGRHELMRVLVKHFAFAPTDISDHNLLASIPHFTTIFTTNYDSLIENAYPKGQCVVLTASQGCSNDDCAPVKIYKIHGDLSIMSDPQSVIITNEDYRDYFNNKNLKVLWEDLKQAFIHTYVVFIGYGLADDNIMQIINQVRNELNGNVKGMYLIAPSLPKARQEEIKRNGIEYIPTTGEVFLNEVKKTIDNTIVKDFKSRKLEDNGVFVEYLHRRGLNPIVQYESDHNIINNILGYNGHKVTTDLKLMTSKEIMDSINNRMYNGSHEFPGTKLTLPAYEIEASALVNGELRINDILIANKNDWKKIWVLPSNKLQDVVIKVPSANFMEKTQVVIFDGGSNSIGVKFDIKIGEMCVMLNFDEEGHLLGKITIDTELYDKYDSSSEALQWIEVALAVYSGQYVNFGILGIEEKPVNLRPLKEFKRIKRYYEAVKRLELIHNIQFKEYHNYSEDGLMCALILDSYLSKKGIAYGLIKTYNCELDTSERNSEGHDLIQSKEPMAMALTYVNFSGKFNGYEFFVPYVNICLTHCVVKEYRKISKDRYSLKVIDEAEENLIYGSDTPAEQKGNVLEMQS